MARTQPPPRFILAGYEISRAVDPRLALRICLRIGESDRAEAAARQRSIRDRLDRAGRLQRHLRTGRTPRLGSLRSALCARRAADLDEARRWRRHRERDDAEGVRGRRRRRTSRTTASSSGRCTTPIERFGDIAHVFSTYESRHASSDDKPFARGINSFQLVRIGDDWKVLTIFWEEEDAAHPIPPAYLPER